MGTTQIEIIRALVRVIPAGGEHLHERVELQSSSRPASLKSKLPSSIMYRNSITPASYIVLVVWHTNSRLVRRTQLIRLLISFFRIDKFSIRSVIYCPAICLRHTTASRFSYFRVNGRTGHRAIICRTYFSLESTPRNNSKF